MGSKLREIQAELTGTAAAREYDVAVEAVHSMDVVVVGAVMPGARRRWLPPAWGVGGAGDSEYRQDRADACTLL